MDKSKTSKIVMNLIDEEKILLMKSAINKLNEQKDYCSFTETLREFLNIIEYRFNSTYKKIILQIWKKHNKEIYSELDELGKFQQYNDVLCHFEYAILNEISQLIKENNLSYVEAWEIIRDKLIEGQYSLSSFQNFIK